MQILVRILDNENETSVQRFVVYSDVLQLDAFSPNVRTFLSRLIGKTLKVCDFCDFRRSFCSDLSKRNRDDLEFKWLLCEF